MSMSQEGLGARLGVSFQQVQKYENVANRISCSSLFRISQILDAQSPSSSTPLIRKSLKQASFLSLEVRHQTTHK
jgi:transcriptional regulator with XRE-family HTH domain